MSGSNVCGTGLGNVILPGDPSLNTPILSAQSARLGIAVSWTYPDVNPHAVAYTLLYRSTQNDFDTAIAIRRVSGDYYLDQYEVTVGTTFYYWIRMVSVNGTIGDVIGPASATRLPTVDEIIDLLEGRLDESQLVEDLKQRINRITDVASALDTETQNRLLGEDVLSQLLAGLADDLEAVDTLVANEITERIGADSALVGQINIILAKANENAAAILQEQVVRADADSAIALQVDTLQATVGDTSASLQTLQQVINGPEGLSAQYMVKTDVNGYVSGFGLYNDGVGSEFIINADRFAVIKPGKESVYPFIIDNVNGVPVIALNATALIPDAQITNGMIGGYIQSDNYNGLGAGWRIDKNGWANFSAITIRDSWGNVILSSGTGLEYSYVNGGPPADATRGAPAGTWVGSRRAEDVAANLSVVDGLLDDGVLTVAEKKTLIPLFTGLHEEARKLRQQAVLTYGVPDVFFQSTQPSTTRVGSVWVNPTAGYAQQRYNGVFWTTISDLGIDPPVRALKDMMLAMHRVGTAINNGATWYVTYTNLPGTLTSGASVDTTIGATNRQTIATQWKAAVDGISALYDEINRMNVNPQNPITSSNVSTYIANLAVDTLRIADEAVTLPRAANGTTQINKQVTLSYPSDARPSIILVWGFVTVTHQNNNSEQEAYLTANTGTVHSTAGTMRLYDHGQHYAIPVFGKIESPGGTGCTVNLHTRNKSASSFSQVSWNLVAMGAKK